MKSSSRIIVCIATALWVCLTSAAFLPVKEENIYKNVIRLHVIANSDSECDQTVKLAVRDALLEKADEIFDVSTYNEAVGIAKSSLDTLEQTANDVLSANGLYYCGSVTLETEDFPTRDYGDAEIPGGKYLSLCVRLGDAKGKNWWCVMFPPMCNGAARSISSVDNCGETATFTKSKSSLRFRLKLFILELFN